MPRPELLARIKLALARLTLLLSTTGAVLRAKYWTYMVELRPVLVMHQSDWAAADGSSGITFAKIMDDAEAAHRAIEVGSNFFLFFSSRMAH